MFPKSKRIPRSAFRNKGQTLSSSSLSLILIPQDLAINRYAVVISKKVDKRATERNRIRRELTSLLQEKDSTLTQGRDLKVIVKHSSPTLVSELTSLLSSL